MSAAPNSDDPRRPGHTGRTETKLDLPALSRPATPMLVVLAAMFSSQWPQPTSISRVTWKLLDVAPLMQRSATRVISASKNVSTACARASDSPSALVGATLRPASW